MDFDDIRCLGIGDNTCSLDDLDTPLQQQVLSSHTGDYCTSADLDSVSDFIPSTLATNSIARFISTDATQESSKYIALAAFTNKHVIGKDK